MGFINSQKVLLSSLSLVVGLCGVNVLGAIAQSSDGLSWRRLADFASPRIAPLVPSKFLNGFENGEIAVVSSNNYRTAYVVAKNGISLDITSKVGNVRNISFMQSEQEARSLPAIADFPQSRYDASQLIEIVKYAPKYDGVGTRNQARESRRATLSNGKTAYYLQQGTDRQGWCVFTDESARYSDFTCVNIANSPKAAFTVLNSLSISN